MHVAVLRSGQLGRCLRGVERGAGGVVEHDDPVQSRDVGLDVAHRIEQLGRDDQRGDVGVRQRVREHAAGERDVERHLHRAQPRQREEREVGVGGVRHHGGDVVAGRDAGGGQRAGPRPGPAVQLGVGERGAVDVFERDRGRGDGGPPRHRVGRQAGGVEHRRMLYTTGGPGPQRRATGDRRRVRGAGGPLRSARPVARARARGLLARAVGAAGRDGRAGHGCARSRRWRRRGDARSGARGRGPRPPAGTGAAGGARGRGSGARGHE